MQKINYVNNKDIYELLSKTQHNNIDTPIPYCGARLTAAKNMDLFVTTTKGRPVVTHTGRQFMRWYEQLTAPKASA